MGEPIGDHIYLAEETTNDLPAPDALILKTMCRQNYVSSTCLELI